MDFLEHPSAELWEQRQLWFEQAENAAAGDGSYLVSEQACALIGEVETAFCAGAWVAVIVLAMAVVDAQLRETESPNFTGSTRRLLDETGADSQLQRLRERRNAIVHVDPANPAITVTQQWDSRTTLEQEARQAVRLMFDAFYMSPGT